MKRAIILAALLLTGCSHTRYVVLHCVTPEQYQQLKDAEPPRVKDKLTGKADEDIKPIAGSNVRLRAWGIGLLGVLGGCQGEEPSEWHSPSDTSSSFDGLRSS